MGQPHNYISVSHVERNAEALATAAEQMTRVAFEMREAGLDQAIFPWAKRQDMSIGLVTRLSRGCLEVLPEQILAHRTGKPSPIELDKQRSMRDSARAKAKKQISSKPARKKAKT